MEKIKLIFFNIPEKLPLVAELHNHYQKKNDYEVNIEKGAQEALREVAAGKNGICIFKVENKADLQIAVTFLKSARKLVKKGLVKPACLLFVKSKKVEGILHKYGCVDILDPEGVRAKTFSFKIDFWSKNLRAQINKAQKELSYKQTSKEASHEQADTVKKEEFANAPALELQSDIWISKHKNDHKKVLRRYLSRLLGPSPRVGQWHELEPKPGDKQTTWKFALNDPEGSFILEDGAWYFSGTKPEFDWKIDRWSFSGDRPHLYFYTKDGKAYSKLKYHDGQVLIADNSTYALTKEDAILETCESNYAFEGDKAEEEESSSHGGEADSIGGKLRGDSSTDNLDGNWDGKSSSDDLGEGKIKGSLSHEHEDELGGNYEGEGATDQIDRDPLSGSLKPEKKKNAGKNKSDFSEDDLGGNYGGKGSTDELDRDPLSGSLKPEKKKNAGKNKSDFSEDDLGGNYGGKGSTDELDRDPLSGSLKPEKKKNAGNNKSDFSEDDLGGNYAGEGSKDELDRDPLSGSLKPEKKKNDGNNKSEFSEDDLGGNYDGKGSTDELDRDPLSGSLRPEKKKNGGNNKSDFSEDDLGGNYDGEGATDELDRDPLSGELKPQKNKRTETYGSEDADSEESDGEALEGGSLSQLKKAGLSERMISPNPNNVGHEKPELGRDIGNAVTFNTESGELKVSLRYSNNGESEVELICGFEDMFLDELVVVAAKDALAVGVNVTATVRFNYGKKKFSLEALGEVTEIEEYMEDKDSVVVALKDVEQKDYDDFMQMYQDRQEHIHEFMKLAKGFE